ncbi:MAG: alpha/beta fold hydrolase [Beijerinckiaceae bacterium]
MKLKLFGISVAFMLMLGSQAARGQTAQPDIIAKQHVFEAPSFSFQNGRTIRNLRFSYETFGTLNAAGDNVIFLPRSYSANARVAGKVTPADAAAGVWSGLIGPGKVFDTEKFFVVASSSLAALPTGDRNTVTTGPVSINPDTGKPYGGSFPIYTIRDMVEADRLMLQSLGVKKIHTLFGVSMGSMQGFEWSVTYPDMVARHIALLPMPEADGFLTAWMNTWSQPIMADPNWAGGNYYDKTPPTAGVVQALNVIHLHQRNRSFGAKDGRKPAEGSVNPSNALEGRFATEDAMIKASEARARIFDANSIVYGARAMALFSPGGKATLEEAFAPVKASTLLIPAKSDILFFPAYADNARDVLVKLGKKATVFAIDGDGGHFDGVFKIGQALPAIQAFMAE